ADARRHWDEYWRKANSDRDFAAQRHATRPFFDPQNQANFPARTPANDAAASERICFYTALFDGYDELRPPAYKPPGVDFICFSDKPLVAAGDVRLIELPGSSAAMKKRRLKILPYEILLRVRLLTLSGLESRLARRPLAALLALAPRATFWRHPQR